MVFRWTGHRPPRHYRCVSFILAMLAMWLGGSPAWATSIQRVEVKSDSIVVTFDQRVADASAFLLASPNRVALDIAGASPGGSVATGDIVDGVREGGGDDRATAGDRVDQDTGADLLGGVVRQHDGCGGLDQRRQ